MAQEGRFVGPPDSQGKKYRLLTQTRTIDEDGATITESVEVVAVQNPDGTIVNFHEIKKSIDELTQVLRDVLERLTYPR